MATPVKPAEGVGSRFFVRKDNVVTAEKQANGSWKVFVDDHHTNYLSDDDFKRLYAPANADAAEEYVDALEPLG